MNVMVSTIARIAKSRRSFGLLLLGILIAVRLSDPAPLEELRLRSFDLFQSLHPRDTKARPVAIIDIDEASLSAYGQWPWPRTLIADMLNRLFELQALAVGFDVVFAEQDRASPAEAMKHFRGLGDEARAHLLQLPGNDDVLAKAMGGGKVVLGQSGTRADYANAADSTPGTAVATLGPDPRPYLIGFPKLLRNLPVLERAAAGRGLFSIVPEKDGIVRRVPVVMKAGDELVPALAFDMLRVASGAQAMLVRSDASGVQSVAMPGLELPTDASGRVWVHFSRHDPSKYISAKDLIDGNVPAEKVAGKLVIIGTSAVGLLDIKTTPVDAAMPGVEIHAQLIEAALANSLLNAPSISLVLEIFGTTIAALLLLALAPIVGALTLFLTAALAIAVFAGTSWVLYAQYQTLLDPTFPLIVTLTIYIGLTLIGYFQEEANRQHMRAIFEQYLAPDLVEQVVRSRQKVKLGGEVRHITILFSDVRGFTAVSETFANDPTGLTSLMNRLLTSLTNAIKARRGLIDKYMGDAVMALWNAPLENQFHEKDACSAALDMLDGVNELNRARQRESSESGLPFVPIRVGIGINTGQCVVGNMGSEFRLQYTAMGDAVNLASRLEGQTATYNVPVIVGSKTAEAVARDFAMLEVDMVRVKGKSRPEVIHAIIGRSEVADDGEFKLLRDQWSILLSCYRKRDWTGVIEMVDRYRELYDKFGLNGLADLYADRCRKFSAVPPPSDWDGVYTAETK